MNGRESADLAGHRQQFRIDVDAAWRTNSFNPAAAIMVLHDPKESGAACVSGTKRGTAISQNCYAKFKSCRPDLISKFSNVAQLFRDYQVQKSWLQFSGHKCDCRN